MTERLITLRAELAELVETASDGEVPAADALAGTSLSALGLTSLGFLRLVDAVENGYGVALDARLEQADLDTVDGLAAQLAGQLAD